MGFSRHDYWSGLLCPPAGHLPNPGIEPRSPTLQVNFLLSEPPGKPMNTGVGSLSLLQGIFLTQEWNQGLMHHRQILFQLSYQGSPNLWLFWPQSLYSIHKATVSFHNWPSHVGHADVVKRDCVPRLLRSSDGICSTILPAVLKSGKGPKLRTESEDSFWSMRQVLRPSGLQGGFCVWPSPSSLRPSVAQLQCLRAGRAWLLRDVSLSLSWVCPSWVELGCLPAGEQGSSPAPWAHLLRWGFAGVPSATWITERVYGERCLGGPPGGSLVPKSEARWQRNQSTTRELASEGRSHPTLCSRV